MDNIWLNTYKSSGWDIDKVIGESSGYSEPLQTHLVCMVNNSVSNRLPIVIPRIDSNQELHFYLVAENNQQAEELFSTTKAYLGSCYTVFRPMKYRSSEDAFERKILDIFPQGYQKLSIPKACSSQDKVATYWVMDSLNRVVAQFNSRPVSSSSIKRPIGVVLRNFFTEIQNQNGSNALQLLDELKGHRRLSPRNYLSLEMQALACDGQWRKITQHPKIEDLLKGTIPRRLQNALLGLVGFTSNNSTDPGDYDYNSLSEQLQSLHPLFASAPDLEDDEASIVKWKLWAMGSVALGMSGALRHLPENIGNAWVNDLREWATLTPLESGRTTISISAIAGYIDADISSENGSKLLVNSVEANFKDRKDIYLRLCEYPPEIIESLSANNSLIQLIWSKLREDHSDHMTIDSWHHLFIKLADNCSLDDANNALTVTIDRSEYWTADIWQEHSVLSDIEKISDDISQGTLRGILPILLPWLLKNKKQLPSSAIEYLMLVLVSDDQISAEDLLLTSDLLLMLLSQAHAKPQYNNLLDCVDECWDKIRSPRSVDPMIEIYEILIDYPCVDENRRLQSWLNTQSYFIKNWVRLDNQQQQICYELSLLLCNDTASLPSIVKDESKSDYDFVDLSGKRLAIYTLTEGAGRRAQKILCSEFPGLEVKLNHDKSGTEALLNLADTADYFVFSSRSAAHQAFYPVSMKRKDLIYPKGKGASSIVREFLAVVV